MTQQSRRALRRNGTWLIEHHLVKLGCWFYELANADWEMEQADVRTVREVIAHRRREASTSDS